GPGRRLLRRPHDGGTRPAQVVRPSPMASFQPRPLARARGPGSRDDPPRAGASGQHVSIKDQDYPKVISSQRSEYGGGIADGSPRRRPTPAVVPGRATERAPPARATP